MFDLKIWNRITVTLDRNWLEHTNNSIETTFKLLIDWAASNWLLLSDWRKVENQEKKNFVYN